MNRPGSALVTGGAGFIGSRVASALLERGWAVDVLDNLSTGTAAAVPAGAGFFAIELGRDDTVQQLPNHNYDAILHLAGQSSGEKSFDDPTLDHDCNARSTTQLATWALDRGIPRLIYASSMGVYGNAPTAPITEQTPCRPVSWYGASKLSAEQSLMVARDLGLQVVALRMFSIYGPGQNLTDMRQGMVSIFLAMLRKYGTVEVRGTLDRVRDFVYIDDCVEAWLKALQANTSGTYNVGTGVGTSVQELIAILIRELDLPAETIISESGPTLGDQRSMIADRASIARDLGWVPATDLATGIRLTTAWSNRG